jgi:hypothetical protein
MFHVVREGAFLILSCKKSFYKLGPIEEGIRKLAGDQAQKGEPMTIFWGYDCLWGIQPEFCKNAKVFALVLAGLRKNEIQFSDVYGKYICNTLRSRMICIYIFPGISGTEYAYYK